MPEEITYRSSPQQNTQEYLSAIMNSYKAVIEICLREDSAALLCAAGQEGFPADMRTDLAYSEENVKECVKKYVCGEQQQEAADFLGRENLTAVLGGRGNDCMEFRFRFENEPPVWMQAELLPVGGEERQTLLCMMKRIRISEPRLFQLGIEHMIFESGEYTVDLGEREKDILLKRAMEEAKRDALTMLYNQKAMNMLVDYELENKQQKGAILFIDLDNFKEINDRFGHLVGDEVLQRVARQLEGCVKKKGIAGRIGGDEFIIFLAEDDRDTGRNARELCGCLQKALYGEFPDLRLTCSIGIALYPRDGEDYGTLVGRADQALYQAKGLGKNGYVFYESGRKRALAQQGEAGGGERGLDAGAAHGVRDEGNLSEK